MSKLSKAASLMFLCVVGNALDGVARPGTLHFEIPASAVESILLPGAPDRYAGAVTVIWDSEV